MAVRWLEGFVGAVVELLDLRKKMVEQLLLVACVMAGEDSGTVCARLAMAKGKYAYRSNDGLLKVSLISKLTSFTSP